MHLNGTKVRMAPRKGYKAYVPSHRLGDRVGYGQTQDSASSIVAYGQPRGNLVMGAFTRGVRHKVRTSLTQFGGARFAPLLVR